MSNFKSVKMHSTPAKAGPSSTHSNEVRFGSKNRVPESDDLQVQELTESRITKGSGPSESSAQSMINQKRPSNRKYYLENLSMIAPKQNQNQSRIQRIERPLLPRANWDNLYLHLTLTYILLGIWFVLVIIAGWLHRQCQRRPEDFPICRAISNVESTSDNLVSISLRQRVHDNSAKTNLTESKKFPSEIPKITETSRIPKAVQDSPKLSVPPPPPKLPGFFQKKRKNDGGSDRTVNSVEPGTPVISAQVRHELFQELENYFLRGNKFKPSSIRQFRGNKNDRSLSCPIDHDIIIYGRGPIAYATVWQLLQQHHDVILITPDSYEVTTHYLIGSMAHLDIPNSIRFYLEDLRLTSATPEELMTISEFSGVPIPIVKRIYEEFLQTLPPMESSIDADEVLREIDPSALAVKSYRLNVQSRFPVPDSRIRRGILRSFAEKLSGAYVEILFETEKRNTEQLLRCRKFILADEFLPNIPMLWSTWLHSAPSLSGPFGYEFESVFESKPFSKVAISGSAIISMHHTGEIMTISVSQVFPYLHLETGGYYLKASVVHRSDPMIEANLRQILNRLGDETVSPKIEPINFSGSGNSMGTWGIRPTGLVTCHKHFRLKNYQSVWIMGPLFLPVTRDWLRDTCIVALMVDRIIALN